MNDQQLAVFGGPKAVRKRYRERWRKVHLRDLIPILRMAIRDVNTQGAGGGLVGKLETGFTKLTQAKYALAMNTGTATLHSAYFAAGVKPGTEVIVPTYTFFASAAPVLQCGGTPVFCDIDARTLTADPDDVERRITEKTKAICVVHVRICLLRKCRFHHRREKRLPGKDEPGKRAREDGDTAGQSRRICRRVGPRFLKTLRRGLRV